MENEKEQPVNYHNYLLLDNLLNAQQLESAKKNKDAHDEMLFIVIHQTYELWFKQVLYELDSICKIMQEPYINDNSPALQIVVHRLERIVKIISVMVEQIDIMETMTPMDFLDFRDLLRPASGFQSWQFKLIEARLGLQFETRHGGNYYTSQLTPAHLDIIKAGEQEPTLLQLVENWLSRMPSFADETFWKTYRENYEASLADGEKHNLHMFDEVFDKGTKLSPKAARSALFIMLYRGYPMLHLPFQLLNKLLEIDEQLSTWRYRHMHMVQRVIGVRQGTGGSSGKNYLQAALEKHIIFRSIAELNSFLVERGRLPVLSKEVEQRLGFVSS